MTLIVPISKELQARSDACTHPGLILDKFARSYDPTGMLVSKWQESIQLPTVERVSKLSAAPLEGDFRGVANRRSELLKAVGVASLRCNTVGPLTLHLSRASALENAGICLHPLYGFAYLPGSGLKGMARAYAETIWLPTKLGSETDASDLQWNEALDLLDAILGFAPHIEPKKEERERLGPLARCLNDRRRSRHRQRVERGEGTAATGNIVFHDAWPETWPRLIVDIVNNHHPAYYGAKPDDNEHPPGDWENPVPVYFLAVQPGVTFSFPLSKRRADAPDGLLDLARQWLLGALCHLGAGAKTAAGYGAFKPVSDAVPQLPSSRAWFETTLELITPAFLAGANQQAEDCDLRSATLRGQLRWWWRTMHAGFVDVETLRALEAALWGDTKTGGAVRIVVEKASGKVPQPYDKRAKASFNEQQKRSEYGISGEDPRKTTQGLWYVSYGMDETNRRRCYIEGASWKLKLLCRQSQFLSRADASDRAKAAHGPSISAEQVLNQARAALWLLCHFGGVGSKARKGFGSMSVDNLQEHTLEVCRNAANQLRQSLELGSAFDPRRAKSPSIEQMLGPVEVTFTWPSIWNVLDQVGFAYQSFAKKYKHRLEKKALGQPRRIGPPVQGKFNPSPPVTRDSRHAAPIQIHLDRQESQYGIRVVAFPAAHLPDITTSRTVLEEFLHDFGNDLGKRALLTPLGERKGPAPPRERVPATPAGPLPVRVTFIGPHEKLKNAFWVQESGLKRGLLKYGTPPTPLPAPDTQIEVYRSGGSAQSPEYRWDKPAPPPESRGNRPHGRK